MVPIMDGVDIWGTIATWDWSVSDLPHASTHLAQLSFRQLLLAAFLLIAMVLSAASVQALFTLKRLAMQSREAARQAVQLTEQSQRLAERTVAMERSARQFLVLDDNAFRVRYLQAQQEARAALQALAAGILLFGALGAIVWRLVHG